MHFDISEVVWALCGLYAIYSGITRFSNKNAYKYKYTEESFLKFGRFYRAGMCVIGIVMIWGAVIDLLLLPRFLTLINIIVLILAALLIFAAYKKVLVEK